ncbi:nucleotidyltransferase domain-containing protein [Compostibacter hankyongensis]|uniref:Nucleotidyltransferase domain-containing protein n=2 Tax=Compostibacter hankyongensis TaxID=1007089 RepID=A0ABP8FQ72_9BACT
MSTQETLYSIKSTVHSFLPDARVFLFGSRSSGTQQADSDYDLLVVTQEAYAPREKMNWESKIRKALVWSLHAPFDVILQSKHEVDRYRNSKGYITYYALKDAVEL